MDPQAPPVVAVVVTADPGPWLEETLRGLAAQDYPNLSVLVVDGSSAEDPTPRIADLLPGAYVRRLPSPVGFAAAANEAMQAVEGTTFLLMCHDDVALDSDATRLMVEEAYRSNAGVVGPKLVRWDDPTRLLQVGMSIDKAGVPVAIVQPGELDQEQHDAVRDVFVVPGGAVLVRADLFHALGGFDARMTIFGEDVDLCWRSQLAGARVIVAPSARARHLAAASSGARPLQDLPGLPSGDRSQLYLRRRHELRAALKCYGRWHLLRVLPLLVAHSVAEMAAGLLTGQPAAARAAASAWTWNLCRAGDLRRARAATQALRRLPDAEVRLLQARGSARLRALAEAMVDRASNRVQDWSEAATDAAVGPGRPWWASLVWGAIAVFWLVGSRSLLGSGPPQVGQMLGFGSAGHLLASYAASVRPSVLGQVSSPPLALALTGVASFVLGGSSGLARTVLTLGMLPLGALGAQRLARPLGSRRARLLAPLVYLALPLPYGELATGRWPDLVAYAAAPWLLARLLAAAGLEPFGCGRRSPWRAWVGTSLVLALSGAVAPGLVPVVVLAALALVLAAPFCGGLRGSARALGVAVAGGAGAWLLAFPWSAGLVSPGAQLEAVLGVRPAVARAVGIGDLLGFHSLPGGTDWVGWALLAGMAVPILFGRDWRLAWGGRLWFVALACWFVAWAAGRGWLAPFTLGPGAALAMAGAALALCAALGVVAFEVDLVGYGLGWRQVVSVLGVVGVGIGSAGALSHIADGRWGSPAAGFAPALSALPASTSGGPAAELWVGDPSTLPGAGWRYQPGVAYLVSAAGEVPDISYDWPPPDPGPASAAARQLALAQSGRDARVGQGLARMGVRYVLLATGSAARGVPPILVSALENQVDLRPISAGPSLLVFENVDWRPGDGLARPAPAGTRRAWQLALEGLLWAAAVAFLWLTRHPSTRSSSPS